MKNKEKKQSGFTLIELLISIAIIAVIVTITTASFYTIRENSRNTTRVQDIKQIQIALERYYQDYQTYPENLSFGESLKKEEKTYLSIIPENPNPQSDGDCPNSNYSYNYNEEDNSYSLSFCLSKKSGEISTGMNCAYPRGILNEFCCGHEIKYEGYNYATVEIGDQCWFAENLKHNDGCNNVTWVDDSDEGWCGYYENNESTYGDYGLLYQWSAAMNWDGVNPADPLELEGAQGLCPPDWHVPTDQEWTNLTNYLEGISVAGDKLKASSTNTPVSWDGSNSSGFTALPTGGRSGNGSFHFFNSKTYFWSSEGGDDNAWGRSLNSDDSSVNRSNSYDTGSLSVRCLKN